LLGERVAGRAHLEEQFLGGPADVYLPALVPEVPLDLAGDARLGIGRQARAEHRVEVVDRLEQSDVPDLHQVLGRFRAVGVPADTRPDELCIPAHQDVARRRAVAAAHRQRPHRLEQFQIVQTVQRLRPAPADTRNRPDHHISRGVRSVGVGSCARLSETKHVNSLGAPRRSGLGGFEAASMSSSQRSGQQPVSPNP
jgi:hypothetical protein